MLPLVRSRVAYAERLRPVLEERSSTFEDGSDFAGSVVREAVSDDA